jgi:hypothetical protein
MEKHAEAVKKCFADAGKNVGPVSHNQRKIPPGKRTRPLSLKDAVRYMGYTVNRLGNPIPSKKAAESLRKAMDARAVPFEALTRKRFVFSCDDFPMGCWPKILPKP